MSRAFIDGLIAGYGIAIPVGAIAVLILSTGMHDGFRAAAAAGAGTATADLVYATLAVVAGSTVSTLVADRATGVKLASGLVVGLIGVYGLVTAGARTRAVASRAPRAAGYLSRYVRFLGLTIVNPLTVVYFTSLVVGLGLGSDRSAAAAAVFAGGAFLASLSWQILLAGIGTAAGRALSPRFRLWTTVGGNLIVVALAVRIVSGI